MKIYIDDMLKKNFVRLNSSFYAISIFIIKKSNENLRVCVDYKIFNILIIKNRNVFLLKIF